ncbi:MAG TPA: SIMPL domain-containing protein [Xanthobacteraceae bacterium]|nr:SIMPL domain-containing protein [Xanthobacteraceae bacterium]
MRALTAALAAAAVSAGVFAVRPATAAVERPFPIITVTGEGSVRAQPDLAKASAGVVTEAKTPREATEANAKAMESVIAALKEAGLTERDIRTSRFSISPIYGNRERGGPQRLTGFRVANQVTATVRTIGNLGAILDKLVEAGANEITGVTFSVSDRSKRLDEARIAAIADAKRKAELLAKAAGAHVGRAVNIAEDEIHALPRFREFAPAMAAAPDTPISPGEETLRVRVTVSFELNQ